MICVREAAILTGTSNRRKRASSNGNIFPGKKNGWLPFLEMKTTTELPTMYFLYVHISVSKENGDGEDNPTWWNNFWIIAPRTFFSFSPFCVLHIMITLSVLFYLENIFFFFLLTVSSFVADWIMTDRRRCMAAVPCTAWNKRSLVYPGSMHQVSWCQPHPPILADPTNKKKKTFLLLVTLAVRIR